MQQAMMDPELLRLAQEHMSRISPDELARMQRQLMSNPELLKMASESMKNMRIEDLKRAADQLKNTRPEEVAEISEKISKAKPEELAAMKAQADAHISYEIAGAKMLKQQGNDLHNHGQYSEAAEKYRLAKSNLCKIPSSAAQTLQVQCSVNLMSCYLKTQQYNECITEGSEVLACDPNNLKAYYRRGQAYRELGKFDAALADLEKAHEISPDDETIASVLRDARDKLGKEGSGKSKTHGDVIEEIVEEEEESSVASSGSRSSSADYSVSPTTNVSSVHPADDSGSKGSRDPNTSRSFENYASNSDPNVAKNLRAQGMSPELVKTAASMMKTMKPEELQQIFQVASSLNGSGSAGSMLGSSMPEMSPDMVKMASGMIGKMSPEELQRMLDIGASFGAGSSASGSRASGAPGQSESSSISATLDCLAQTRGVTSNGADSTLHNQQATESSSKPSVSTADMHETLRNSMNDPAMRQMFSSMMKNMNPEMMAEMSEQFGMKISKEDAERAQQAMSSLSPDDLDKMLKWAGRAQQGLDAVKKTKNWLLGRQGLILAVVMLIIAFIFHQLGFIG